MDHLRVGRPSEIVPVRRMEPSRRKGRGPATAPALPEWRFAATPRSGADHPCPVELNSCLAVGVHGEVRMKVGQDPGSIRSTCDDVIEIGVLLYEQVAALDGPDALRIARPKVPCVGRTGPVERNRYDLAVNVLVEVNRPGIREKGAVHDCMDADGLGVELVLA